MNTSGAVAEDVDQVSADDTAPLEPADLLMEIVRALVDHPQDVSVSEHGKSTACSLFEIHVHADDRGKVIGRGGAMIDSLRVVMMGVTGADHRKASVEVADSQGHSRCRAPRNR